MIIRNYTKEDTEAVRRITEECTPYIITYPDYMYFLYANLYDDTCRIAEENGEVIGFLTCLPDPKHNAIFAWQMGVAKEHRHKGVAYALLKSAYLRARELGLSCIISNVNAENAASLATFRKVAAEFDLVPEKIGVYEWPGVFDEDLLLFAPEEQKNDK